LNLKLPKDSPLLADDFLFGVATSSFQIEGAAESRLKCIWDTFCEQPGKIRDGSNGLVACDHLDRWPEDVALMKDMGVDAYRLSLSWPRIIREDGSPNEAGLDVYRRLLDGLAGAGIRAFVTLYHWDLPQHLEDAGGWLRRDTSKRFTDYADIASRALGDRVHSWATLNEPWCAAHLGYGMGIHAPGLSGTQYGIKAAHHLLLAHGLAMPVLADNCPNALNGIVLNFSPCHPAGPEPEHARAARMADDLYNQWYARPVLCGEYPEVMEHLAADERPDIEAGDMATISHPIDFLGVNYYTRTVYRHGGERGFEPVPPQGPHLTDMGWEVYPQGLEELLVDLDSRYELPPILVTENGIALPDERVDGIVNDPRRGQYIQQHLDAVDAAARAGVDLRGYFHWSLMDNFEWAEGYTKRFGLVHVDFDTQERTLKDSAKAWRAFLQGRR